MEQIEDLATQAINVGLRVHRQLGPGMLESVYEAVLAMALRREGLEVQRQVVLPITFEGIVLEEACRIDLLLEGRLIIEVKSVEKLSSVHGKQLLTYLRLAKQPLGLLMNFGNSTLKEGLKRVVNEHHFASSRLRVNQSLGST